MRRWTGRGTDGRAGLSGMPSGAGPGRRAALVAARAAAGLAAGVVVTAALSGWGIPQAAAGPEQAEAARAVVAVTQGADPAPGAVPPDFPAVMGYRPVLSTDTGRALPTRDDGSCTSPFGETRYRFGDACRRHDLGYDLLRYAAAKGHPLGPWAREAVDAQFTRALFDRCDGAGCLVAATVYVAAVELNSWRQGWGVPVVERPGEVLPPVLAGLAVAALIASAGLRRAVRTALAAAAGRAVVAAATVRQAGRPVLLMPARRAAGAAVRARGAVARTTARVVAPRAGRLLLAATALVLSLQPGMLPRPGWVQIVAAGAAAAQVYAVATLTVVAGAPARALGRWHARRRPARTSWSARVPRPPRRLSAAAGTGVVLTGLTAAYAGQARLAAGAGMPAPTPSGQLAAAAGAVAVALVLIAGGAGAVRALRFVLRPAARPVAAVVLAPLLVLTGNHVAAADAVVPPGATLGAKGRQFLAGTPDPARLSALTGRPAVRPVRVYVGLDDAPGPRERARAAVSRLESAGAFDREVLLVAVPTGSGWVNPAAPAALERLHGGDVASVAVQYASSPSWVSYLRGGEGVRETVRATLEEVSAAVDRRPADRRPRIVVYGESLGAWGGLTAYPEPEDVLRHADAALWVGVPAGAPPVAPGAGMRVLMNADDPVRAWSPELLVSPSPAWPGTWLPIVTFWQVTADVVASPAAPVGHGHRYGPAFVDAWADLVPPSPGSPAAAPPDVTGELRADVARLALAG